MKKLILNCSSFSSALESAYLALNTSPEVLLPRIIKIGDSITRQQHLEGSFEEILFKEISNEFEISPFSEVYWFHLTRTWPSETFEEGLLPRSLVEFKIWSQLVDSITKENETIGNKLKSLRTYNEPLKKPRLDQWVEGPCGMLIRDHAFHPAEIGNGDFLYTSEFFLDLNEQYKERYGSEILLLITNLLTPCIVMFKESPPEFEEMNYLHSA